MNRAAVVAVVLGGVAAAAPVPKETDGGRLRQVYGAVDDPGGTARVDLLPGDRLRVGFPAARLRPLVGHRVADAGWRTGREVSGDFTAVVRVSFPLEIPADAAPDRDHEVAAAGLIAASADGESVSVVRTLGSHGGLTAEGFQAARRTRRWEDGVGNGLALDPRDRPAAAYVRLVRSGFQVVASFGRDGKEWRTLGEYLVGWPDRVTVGVIAANGHAARFEATFDRYSVTQPKK